MSDNDAGLLAYLRATAIGRKFADLDITIDEIVVAATRAPACLSTAALCCAHLGVGFRVSACGGEATRAATGSLFSDLDTADDIAKAIADHAPATRRPSWNARRALVDQGAKVTVVAREKAALAAVEQRLGVAVIAADVTDQEAARRILADVRPEVLVLNAGTPPRMGRLDQLGWADFTAPWETDVKGRPLLDAGRAEPSARAGVGAAKSQAASAVGVVCAAFQCQGSSSCSREAG